jgi:dethiobiotin synthase
MISGLFVTGTGTDVGKTRVVAGVMRWFLKRGVNAMVMKPVQTGAERDAEGRRVAPDVEFVSRASGLCLDEETRGRVTPYLFDPACSPHLAARLAGCPIRIERVLECAQWLADRHDRLVVEGAGGLMVPLGEAGTMLDLAAALGLPTLLVGHSGLGTINHVLLSLDALRQRGVTPMGVILNDCQPVPESSRFIHDDNAAAIETFGSVRVLARIPYLGAEPDWDRLDAALAGCDFMGGQ